MEKSYWTQKEIITFVSALWALPLGFIRIFIPAIEFYYLVLKRRLSDPDFLLNTFTVQ